MVGAEAAVGKLSATQLASASTARENAGAGEVAQRSNAAALKAVAGRVAEWSIALVLKTSDGKPSVGSNPTPSAI